MLELCLAEGSADILELQMFKVSPELVNDELKDGGDCSIDGGGELSMMCRGS